MADDGRPIIDGQVAHTVRGQRLHLLPESPTAFLKTKLIGWPAKLRVAGEVFVLLRRVLAAQQFVAVRKATVLVDDVLVQFRELGDCQERLLLRR